MSRAVGKASGSGAPQPAQSSADVRRVALDGQAYTWAEYEEAYGEDAQRFWDDAYGRNASQLAVNAYGEPQPTAAIDGRGPHEDGTQRQQNDSGASQPAGAEETTAQIPALPSVCTFRGLQEMQPVKGMGVKAASVKQRELRQVCLENEVFEIDVTETWPEWRAVLRALPKNMQQLIVGHGIARVKFRLLEGVRDANWAKKDSGERRVFEIVRTDSSKMHLHYHKNGRLDDPVLIDPIGMPQNANSGASELTVPFTAPSPSQPLIGRREAVLALTVLLNACCNNGAGAVDITDGYAFDWKRFLANTMEHLEISAMDLEKVFALRTADSGSPKLALCTTGTTWEMLDPTQKNTKIHASRACERCPLIGAGNHFSCNHKRLAEIGCG